MMAVLLCGPMVAKETDSKKTEMSAEMMEKWKAYSTPGAAHKQLEPLVGSWTYTSKMWEKADAKPEMSSGKTDTKWILGGRFVESTVTGTAMGQPFEGRLITGYDNEKKEYNSVWLDSMATGMMVSKGEYDAANRQFSDAGTASCPFEGTKTVRGVTTMTSPNSYTYEMYMNGPDNKGFKTMEIKYTRSAL